jgi:hypothetical protein
MSVLQGCSDVQGVPAGEATKLLLTSAGGPLLSLTDSSPCRSIPRTTHGNVRSASITSAGDRQQSET